MRVPEIIEELIKSKLKEENLKIEEIKELMDLYEKAKEVFGCEENKINIYTVSNSPNVKEFGEAMKKGNA